MVRDHERLTVKVSWCGIQFPWRVPGTYSEVGTGVVPEARPALGELAVGAMGGLGITTDEVASRFR